MYNISIYKQLESTGIDTVPANGMTDHSSSEMTPQVTLTNELTASQHRLVAPMCSAVPPLKHDVRSLSRSGGNKIQLASPTFQTRSRGRRWAYHTWGEDVSHMEEGVSHMEEGVSHMGEGMSHMGEGVSQA